MPNFSKKRKILLGITSSVNQNSTKLKPFTENSNRNWIQNLVQISNERDLTEKCAEKSMNIQTKIVYEKCCEANHISEINDTNKRKILNYFKELNNHNRENDYLKGLIIPTNIKRRRKSENEEKNQNFKHSLILLKLKMKGKKFVKMHSYNYIKLKEVD
jgi:hypothetical protein